jgi:glycosyltransferase involved in cell wall biosynthesis
MVLKMDKTAVSAVVSVSCLTFNHEKYLEQAIDSFLMQEVDFPFEILIHDDASTDGTADILRAYQVRYPEIIKPIFQKENQLSRGIRISPTYQWPRALGKYIAMCEGDDYWTDPQKLQKQIDYLEARPDFAGCFHETLQIFEDGRNGQIYGREASPILTPEDTFSITSPFHTSSFVFRNIIGKLPDWYSSVISGDMALFSIVASHGFLGKIPEIMSVYRKHAQGFTNSPMVIDTYNQNRIMLMNRLNEFHGFRYDAKAKKVIAVHEGRMRQAGF